MVTAGRTVRIVSRVICVIVIAWFLVFAVNQTKTASGHQQRELNGQGQTVSEQQAEAAERKVEEDHRSSVHRALDETAEALTSPFSGMVSGSSEWLKNGELALVALLVYGFGLGYLARMMRAP
jgi:flagellar biosynthesis/type III secretory pathway M-ring protein FliF/YscJ